MSSCSKRGDGHHVQLPWTDKNKIRQYGVFGRALDRNLPNRSDVTYTGFDADRAEVLVQMGSHIIVEMLDPPPAKKRGR
jgi:hypothetical protein